ITTERVVTTSTDSSASGPSSSARASTNSQRSSASSSSARPRLTSSSSCETSLKMTFPLSPTSGSAPNAIKPSPAPTSRTTSPSRTVAPSRTRSRTGPRCRSARSACSGSPPKRRSSTQAAHRSWTVSGTGFGEQRVQVERLADHGDALAVERQRPLLPWTVAVELEPVAVGIVEVDRLADAVIGGAGDGNLRLDEPFQRIRQRSAGRIAHGHVVEAGRPGWRRGAALRLPGVEPDVMVIVAGREESRLVAHPLLLLEPEDVSVERECAVEVGDLQVNMPDVHSGVDWPSHVRTVLGPTPSSSAFPRCARTRA